MLNYIALYPNEHEKEFNDEFILGTQDPPIEDFVIMAMKEFEAIENITIEDIRIVHEQDEVDINNHMININFKKKDLDKLEIPKFKYMANSRYGEIIFRIRVKTNLNEKVIDKRILIPMQTEDGFYINNDKRMKAIWQLVDASTYSQRGKITLKSRMPIIIYHNKHRIIQDIHETEFVMPSYSYALNTKSKKPGAKTKTKFINPLMIYSAKMGFKNTLEFFGMKDCVFIASDYTEKDEEKYYIFPVDEIFVKVDKNLYDKYDMVKAFVCMSCNLRSKDFPVDYSLLEDRLYWTCRIGYIGSAKNKNIMSFKEKGTTTVYMIERLLDATTIRNLRLPDIYKHNIYFLMYWLITNFNELKKRSNVDMANKRIRRNEYIVNSSLGKKINENINKLVEKKSKSKMNTMDTLMELFNFNSDIVVSGMRNLNDLVKSDDIVNDLTFIADLSYSSKGFQSQMESGAKMISAKYRYIHPSMVGKLDLNVSSNSDVGMSGSFTPFVKLYNGYYFTPETEPCSARYEFDKELKETEHQDIVLSTKDLDSYLYDLEHKTNFSELLKYESIEIVEKDDEVVAQCL